MIVVGFLEGLIVGECVGLVVMPVGEKVGCSTVAAKADLASSTLV